MVRRKFKVNGPKRAVGLINEKEEENYKTFRA